MGQVLHFLSLRYIPLLILSFITGVYGYAQSKETSSIVDTLPPAYKESHYAVKVQTGRIWSDIETIRKTITPIGDGDAIKLIQTLPGISTGAEGSSAIYARGGNLGNNLMSLDGVTIYGISHLLGMTSAISSDAISEMDFQIGGFDADRGSTLASFIELKSAAPRMDKWHGSALVSPLLGSLSASGPVSERTGILVTGRFSPIGLVYESMNGLLSSEKGLHDINATVYDIFGKVQHKTKTGDDLSVSIFRSADGYDLEFGKDSSKYNMGWSNTLGLVRYTKYYAERTRTEYGISYDRYESNQASDLIYKDTQNHLKIRSSINELVADGKVIFSQNNISIQAGGQLRYAGFNPGASSLKSGWADQKYSAFTAVAWGQYEYQIPDFIYFKAATRFNAYTSGRNFKETEKVRFEPELSLLGEVNVADNIKLTATFDRTAQFYHTLEGMPLGWSMDLIVPSDQKTPAESAYQGYLGAMGSFDKHRITVGGYYKTLNNIVYYTNAAAIFSAAMAGWKDNIEVGKGSSYGLETLYEFSGRNFSARIAYTLSKTDRTFENLNNGNPFPAKFDRRHILNTSLEYCLGNNDHMKHGISSAFTFQSGHWESYKEYSYPSITPDGEDILIPYYNIQPNNYHMPNYIRLDVGYFRDWKSASGKLDYKLQAGIYNILNRHNPFMLMYDDDSSQWMTLSLIPIMANISFRIEF